MTGNSPSEKRSRCPGSGEKAVGYNSANPGFGVCPVCGRAVGILTCGDGTLYLVATHYRGTKKGSRISGSFDATKAVPYVRNQTQRCVCRQIERGMPTGEGPQFCQVHEWRK